MPAGNFFSSFATGQGICLAPHSAVPEAPLSISFYVFCSHINPPKHQLSISVYYMSRNVVDYQDTAVKNSFPVLMKLVEGKLIS